MNYDLPPMPPPNLPIPDPAVLAGMPIPPSGPPFEPKSSFNVAESLGNFSHMSLSPS